MDKNDKLNSQESRDAIEKIDSIDKSESPSRTKVIRTLKNDDKKNKNDKPKEKKIGFIGLISEYFIKYWHVGLAILIITLIGSLAVAVGPWIIKNMTSALMISKGQPAEKPIFDISWQSYMYIQFGLFAIIAICQLVGNMLAGFLGKNIEVDLRNRSMKRLITQDMSYYSDKKIGEILTKVVSDTQIIGDQAQGVPVAFISAVFTSVFSMVFMFLIDWKIALVAIGIVIGIMLILMITFGGLRGLMFKVREVITNINGTVINRISTVQLVKTSGTEKYEEKLFDDLHDEYTENYKNFVKYQSMVIMFLFVGISSIQVILTIAMAGIYSNDLATLTLILPSFILAIGTMVGPIMQIIRVIAGLIIASTASQRIASIITSKSKINGHIEDGKGIKINEIKGDIKFKDVVFAYPEKPNQIILPKTNFVFEQGKKYAFVGETGAGKSTISKLLLRFYDPTEGEVLINDEINLKDVNLPSYLTKVGYVEQEPQILLGNIWDNVRYGSQNKTDAEVIEACKKADLHKIISQWPEGYNTVLGERGFMLSGGQKQRLVIARMFLKDPQLLILDEATSALDNIVEQEIQGQLETLMDGRTTVSIAHRLSTIKNADQIIVLSPGQGITQVGTFNELKKQPGHFKELYEAGLMK